MPPFGVDVLYNRREKFFGDGAVFAVGRLYTCILLASYFPHRLDFVFLIVFLSSVLSGMYVPVTFPYR